MSTQYLEDGPDPGAARAVAGLEEQVRSRLGGRVRCFRLAIDARGLVLRGRALTYYAKQLAQHAVLQATTAPVCNEIEVSPAGDEGCLADGP